MNNYYNNIDPKNDGGGAEEKDTAGTNGPKRKHPNSLTVEGFFFCVCIPISLRSAHLLPKRPEGKMMLTIIIIISSSEQQ